MESYSQVVLFFVRKNGLGELRACMKVHSANAYYRVTLVTKYMLDERFSEEKFRFYLDMPFTHPVFVVGNTMAIHKRGITDFHMKYYRRIYQARMVEQRRFDKHSAYLAKELERMNQL